MAAKRPPELASLDPQEIDAGQTRTLKITGKDLGKVTAIEFTPADGVTVSGMRATKKSVTAQVALAPQVPKGDLRVVVVSADGRSNELTLKVRATVDPAFVISNLKVGSVTSAKLAFGEGSSIPITVDYVDPTAALSAESVRMNFDMANGEVTGMMTRRPEGLSPNQTAGTLHLTLEFPGKFRTPGAAVSLKISLEAPEGRKSNELAAVFQAP